MSHFLAIFLPLIDQLKANYLAAIPGFDAKEVTNIIDAHWEDFLEEENHREFGILFQLIEIIFRIAEGKLEDHKEIPSNILSTFMGEMFKVTFLLMCRNLYLQYCSIATQHRIPKQAIIAHLQIEYNKIASEKQAIEADILKTITALEIPIVVSPLALPKPDIPKLEQIRLNILAAYYESLINKINANNFDKSEQADENLKLKTFDQIKDLIDNDILAAFTEMDKLEWSNNHQGDYFALKRQWIDPPIGLSTSDLRNKLKLILSYSKLPTRIA